MRRHAAAAVAISSTLAMLLVMATPSFAAHVRVDVGGSGDYLTISEGIDAVSSGDTVLVAPGTYTGSGNRNLEFHGKAIVVRSELGQDVTIVDCQGLGRGFFFESGESTSSVLDGFTVTHGYGNTGAGIRCDASSPIIANCRLIENTATTVTSGGGGMACWSGSSPTLMNVLFSGNQGDYGGGLLTAQGSAPLIVDARFDGNTGLRRGGGWYCEYATEPYTIGNCDFRDNVVTTPGESYGGALYLYGTSAEVTGVTFARNSAVNGDCIAVVVGANPIISNTILSYGIDDEPISCDGYSTPTTFNCVVYGHADGDSLCGTRHDNLFVNPLFCDLEAGDLTVCADSPCLPPHNPWSGFVGRYGEGCPNCDSPVEARSWGAIKALYR
jgi:hypothetical protein